MNALISHIPNPLRWLLFLPAALGAGFLVGGLIRLLTPGEADASSGAIAYAAAFLSGLGYVWAALYIAHTVAPTHKRVVVTVLGILILGDLSVAHLILQTGLIPQAAVAEAEEGGLGVLLSLLRADEYGSLQQGGVVKIAGVLMGCGIAWWLYVRDPKRSHDSLPGDAQSYRPTT